MIIAALRQVCGLAVPRLTRTAGTPNFRALRDLGSTTIEDVCTMKASEILILIERSKGRKINEDALRAASMYDVDVEMERLIHRQEWLADERFKIVLYTWPLGEELGEIELEQEHELPSDRTKFMMWQRSHARDMDRQIEAFVKKYQWAFKPGRPDELLTAYIDRLR